MYGVITEIKDLGLREIVCFCVIFIKSVINKVRFFKPALATAPTPIKSGKRALKNQNMQSNSLQTDPFK